MDNSDPIILSSDDDAICSDSDSTDYEPESKKIKRSWEVPNDLDVQTQPPSSNEKSQLTKNTGDSLEGDTEDDQKLPESQSPSHEIREGCESHVVLSHASPGEAARYHATLPPSATSVPQTSSTSTRRRRRRRGRRRREDTSESSVSKSETSSSTESTSSYLTGDIDPMEIPSDEVYSPPSPSPPRNRQRRNAIFQRRDPPSNMLVPNEDDRFYHNQFEVASVSDINENPIEDANSTSGADDENIPSPVELLNANKQTEDTDNNLADAETFRSDVDTDGTHASTTKSAAMKSSDSELSDTDKWFCNQCKGKSLPYFRYCTRCFKIRRNWLPKRPASKKLKSRKAAERKLNNSRTTRSSETSDNGEDVVDGGRLPRNTANDCASTESPAQDIDTYSSSGIQARLPTSSPTDFNQGFLVDTRNPALSRISPESAPGNVTILELFSPPQSQLSDTCETGVGSISAAGQQARYNQYCSSSQNSTVSSRTGTTSTSSSQSQLLSQSQPSSSQCSNGLGSPPFSQSSIPPIANYGISGMSSLCTVCCIKEKDAAFVHNKIAHSYSCFSCADKILKKDGKCPICRRRVLRVVKIITV